MALEFVVQVDMPSIKKYVFGTDPLIEVRGASANLDALNRVDTFRLLQQRIRELKPNAMIKQVYANGGSGQFLVAGCELSTIDAACRRIENHVSRETGGEVRTVYGIAALGSSTPYREALQQAHFQLRCQREFGSKRLISSTMPLVTECASASHLPATHCDSTRDGIRMVSGASYQKTVQGRQARTGNVWQQWMKTLESQMPWPHSDEWNTLRCASLDKIGLPSGNKIGIVYADGNAMGRVIRKINSPGVFQKFSRIVDQGIREACFVALQRMCRREVSQISRAHPQNLWASGGWGR